MSILPPALRQNSELTVAANSLAPTMQIGLLATEDERAYSRHLATACGTAAIKAGYTPTMGLSHFAARCKAGMVTHMIVSDPDCLSFLLETQTDFRHPLTKLGKKKKLTLDDYAGTYITIPKVKLGLDWDVKVLFIRPLYFWHSIPEYQFLLKRYVRKITAPESWFPQPVFTWELIKSDNEDHVSKVLSWFADAALVGIDIETPDSPDRLIDCCAYAVLRNDGRLHTFVLEITSIQDVLLLRRLNATPVRKVLQGGMYDHSYFSRYNCPVFNYMWDTLNMFHCWFSELPKRLDFITAFMLRDIRYWKDDSTSGDRYDHFEYNARDAWATVLSCCALIQEMPDWARKNYTEEFPNVFVNHHMNMEGLKVDMVRFKARQVELDSQISEILKSLQTIVCPGFNPGSPKQTKELLMGLGYKGKKGVVESADEKNIKEAQLLGPVHALVLEKILEYRGLAKLRSSYIEDSKLWNGRLFYRIDPAATDTGRAASSESSFWCGHNIQNVPGSGGVKDYIMADDGFLLAEGDKAQAEARCVGYLSGCTALIDLVESERDYHSWNASAFFGVPYDQIYDQATGKQLNKPLRNLSKRTNHGANYNMGPDVMLETMGAKAVMEARTLLGLPASLSLREVCAYLLNTYANTYPEVKRDLQDWVKRTISITRRVTSPLGWTRFFFDDPRNSKPALNAAIAHSPQNLSVSIINKEIRAIWLDIVYGKYYGLVRPKAQIHDSFFFAYREDRPELPEEIRGRMNLAVPVTDIKGVTRTLVIPTDMSAGKKYWSELK